ncbi:metallophosphoesterase [Puteibacter caeruleilacunae]|nr:metallophosphoesterase [Puteibacter caeruleilacunae]
MLTNMKIKLYISIALTIIVLNGCKTEAPTTDQKHQVAFIADAHILDIYGGLSDNAYKGVLNPTNNKHVIARTMGSQLNSTRLFNENYFAFLAALDDIVKRGVKHVVLPGDFTDDGQPLNVRGVNRILQQYGKKYNLRFYATVGNHDPVRPFAMPGGKKDFLGADGQAMTIASNKELIRKYNADTITAVVSKDLQFLGYEGIAEELKIAGFYPQESDVYWETPFSAYDYLDYNYKQALPFADIEKRQYAVGNKKIMLPDVSYLVEPVEGLWILSIDANAYVPKEEATQDPDNPANYGGAGIGYNEVIHHKRHLVSWIKSVTQRAKEMNKQLVVFSHYPMIDFNDDSTDEITTLMGEGKMQTYRIPHAIVSQTFAEAGIKVHFAGHMHINDTAERQYSKKNRLINIQVPSLAAYIPAYKLITLDGSNMEVETIVVDSIPRFKELFPLYQREHDYLTAKHTEGIWNEKILSSESYLDFTRWHLTELVRRRFLKKDWPAELREFLMNASGKELMEKCKVQLSEADLKACEEWTGKDMIVDFYRLRNADKLAIDDIGVERVQQYQSIVEAILNGQLINDSNNKAVEKQLVSFAKILKSALNGAPANHFTINLKDNTITSLQN